MKKINVSVSLSIPRGLYRFRWHNIKNWCRYWINPPKCSCCGTRLAIEHPMITHFNNGYRVIISFRHEESTKLICPSCLAKHVTDDNVRPKYPDTWAVLNRNTKKKCDCCKKRKKSYTWVSYQVGDDKFGIVSGSQWWNGYYFCSDCLRDAIQNGTQSSTTLGWYDGKMVSINNRYGLPVVNGKVRFPWV